MESPKNLSKKETQQLLEEDVWTLDSGLSKKAFGLYGSNRTSVTIYQNADGIVLEKVASLGRLYESREDFIRFLENFESFLRQQSTEYKIPIERRRGNYCHETEDYITLVRAPVEAVAQAINQIWQVKYWEQDVYGRDIDIRKQGFVVFQFRGHSWTCIREYGWGLSLSKEEVQVFGKLLNTRIVNYCVSDTGGLIAYDCYDSGRLVEKVRLELGRPPEFESQLRSLRSEASNNLSNEVSDGFIDEFFEQQNIYMPRLLEQNLPVAQRVTLVNTPIDSNSEETFERDDFERVDYIVRM